MYLISAIGLLFGSEVKSEAQQNRLEHPVHGPQRTIFTRQTRSVLQPNQDTLATYHYIEL
jgi:hypothetical protein